MRNKIINRWHTLGVQGKLHILIQGSLIVLFFISMEWVIHRFENQIYTSAELRAKSTADGLINGMNMLMLTGKISDPENRQLLLAKMKQFEGISELRIIRGENVVKQFGQGLPEEHATDDLDREVLVTGKIRFESVRKQDGAPLLRVLVPFIAQENFKGTNCLSCHDAQAGSVNGVASVVIDLSSDEAMLQNIKNWLLSGHIAIQLFLSLMISMFVRVLIDKHIAEPVSKLQKAMSEIQQENDLSKRVDIDESNPDIGEMARTFNNLVMNLEYANERLELFGKLFDNSSEGIMITDASANILAVNPAFDNITGYSQDEVKGKNPRLLSSGRQTFEFYQNMWANLLEAGLWQGEIWNKRKSGEIYPEWLSIGVVRNIKGEIVNYVSLFSDITERKAAELKINFLAHYDALTRLPNRALFADRLKMELVSAERNNRQVALLFLDLDKFKAINDTLGHTAGDLLLKSVADRLQSCVRESDTVCRQGGDEFLILLSGGTTVAGAENVAEKIIKIMEIPHQLEDQEKIVTFSVGISIFPDNASDCETMIKCADEAMYQAKERGRNNYQFYSKIKD